MAEANAIKELNMLENAFQEQMERFTKGLLHKVKREADRLKVPSNLAQQITQHIPEIMNAHQRVLNHPQWQTQHPAGAYIAAKQELLDLYAKYARDFWAYHRALHLMSGTPPFMDALTDLTRKEFKLTDYALPLLHIRRLAPLVESLTVNAQKREGWIEVLCLVNDLLSLLDAVTPEDAQASADLLALDFRFKHPGSKIWMERRRKLHQGHLKKMKKGKTMSARKLRAFFLMSDCLIWAEDSKGVYKFKGSVGLNLISVSRQSNNRIAVQSGKDSWMLEANSSRNQEEWFRLIDQAIQDAKGSGRAPKPDKRPEPVAPVAAVGRSGKESPPPPPPSSQAAPAPAAAKPARRESGVGGAALKELLLQVKDKDMHLARLQEEVERLQKELKEAQWETSEVAKQAEDYREQLNELDKQINEIKAASEKQIRAVKTEQSASKNNNEALEVANSKLQTTENRLAKAEEIARQLRREKEKADGQAKTFETLLTRERNKNMSNGGQGDEDRLDALRDKLIKLEGELRAAKSDVKVMEAELEKVLDEKMATDKKLIKLQKTLDEKTFSLTREVNLLKDENADMTATIATLTQENVRLQGDSVKCKHLLEQKAAMQETINNQNTNIDNLRSQLAAREEKWNQEKIELNREIADLQASRDEARVESTNLRAELNKRCCGVKWCCV